MSRAAVMLNPVNDLASEGLRRVQAALAALDQAGCLVRACTVIDGRPTLLIQTPHGPFVGAVRLNTNSQGRREALWVAEVAGCRVEWTAPPLQAVPQ